MACQGCLDGYLGSLQIPDLTDHDDVGVLSQYGPQSVGKGEIDPGINLDLADPGKLVLHRVLYGNDVLVGRIYPRQGRIKGRSLPAPGRSRDQRDAVA